MKRLIFVVIAATVVLNSTGADLKSSITWTNILAHPAGLPQIGNLETVKSNLNNSSYWSVGCECLDRDYSNFDNYIQYVGQTGVGYARLQSGWAKTEQKKGKYDFAWLEHQVDGLIENGVHPWICLCYGNPLYTDKGTDLNARLFEDGPVMDAWLKYVKATVSRFKGKVTMFEVWNEPDNWTNGPDTWPLYANMFVRTAKAIREVDPDVKIAGFAAVSPDHLYLRKAAKRIVELGGADLMDYFTFHAYWPVPEYVIEPVKQLMKDIEEIGLHTQFLQGETGCPGQLEYKHAMHNYEWDEYSQAKWDLRQMMNMFSLGIPHSVFTMVDLHYKDFMLQSFGLIRMRLNHVPVYKRPKFYAVQNVASLLTTEFTADPDVTVSSSCGRDITCVGLKKNGKTVGCALWFSGERPTNSLDRQNVNVTINGVHFDAKPVMVDLLSGIVYDLPTANIRGAGSNTNYDSVNNPASHHISQLPMWDSPIVIINRSDINFK